MRKESTALCRLGTPVEASARVPGAGFCLPSMPQNPEFLAGTEQGTLSHFHARMGMNTS